MAVGGILWGIIAWMGGFVKVCEGFRGDAKKDSLTGEVGLSLKGFVN